MVKAVAYIRVSTEEQAREGRASLPAQRARLEAYAQEQELEIVEWYEDAGVSAYKETANREGFNSAIGRALAGDINAFLVLDMSRFYRDSYKAAHYTHLLASSGITLHTVAQQADTATPEGELMQWLNMGLARLESRQNAARVIRAQKQNLEMRDAETGWAYQNGGQPLFGYTALRRPAGRNRKGAVAYKQLWVLDEAKSLVARCTAGREKCWSGGLLEKVTTSSPHGLRPPVSLHCVAPSGPRAPSPTCSGSLPCCAIRAGRSGTCTTSAAS